MAAPSSILAWRIPCREEPDGLQQESCLSDYTPTPTIWDQLLHTQPQVLLLCPLNSFLTLQGRPRGDQTPASVPPPTKGRSSPTNSLFPLLPSPYWVLCGSIYSSPVARYSCLLSAGILQDLLCLKVSSWCISGERRTPHPPALVPPHLIKLRPHLPRGTIPAGTIFYQPVCHSYLGQFEPNLV